MENQYLTRHLFPVPVSEICRLIGPGCAAVNLDETTEFAGFLAADIPFEKDCLFIRYEETDEGCTAMIRKGALAILTEQPIDGGVPCIVVSNILTAILRLCTWMWDSIRLPSIVVAGSEGKTTTKRMVKCVLQQARKVFCQDGNYNTFHALCYTLQKIPYGTEQIVQEVDEKRKNNTVNCSKVLMPDTALITNIAEAHMRFFGSKEAQIDSFQGVMAGMPLTGTIIINGDDPDSVAADFDRNVITIGIQNRNADCLALNVRDSKNGVEFDIQYQGETVHIRLSVPGVHNVYNAMMAFVVGKRYSIHTEAIQKALHGFSNSGIRQNICRIGSTLVYADCYNASATSVRYALVCFNSLRVGRGKKVAVLGDIAEIEGYEESTYRQIADCIDRSSIDVLVTCGKDSEQIHSYVTRDITEKHTQDLKELNEYLEELKKSGAGSYLFKASRVMRLEKSIQTVFPKHYDKLMNKPSRFQRWKRRLHKLVH